MHNWVKTARILVAAMFILSAISKMLSLPFFDGLVAELLVGKDYYNHPDSLFYTQLLTRFLIAAELVLGVALLQEFWLKKLVLPSIMLMLLLFTVHLFYEGFRSEKGFIEGNCGCFGDILPMNNLESILKNVAAMLLGVFIWIKYKDEDQMRFPGWTAAGVLGVVTLITLLLTVKTYDAQADPSEDPTAIESNVEADTGLSSEVVQGTESSTGTEKTSIAKTDVNPSATVTPDRPALSKTVKLLTELPKLSDGKKLDVLNGKTLVCMFSMTCSHCQEIYKEICDARTSAGWPKIGLLNFGKDFEQKYFFNQGGHTFPHLLTEDYIQFNKWLEGDGFPRILAIENGKVVKSWDLDTYSKQSLFDFYGIVVKKEPKDGLQLIPKNDGAGGVQGKNPWD